MQLNSDSVRNSAEGYKLVSALSPKPWYTSLYICFRQLIDIIVFCYLRLLEPMWAFVFTRKLSNVNYRFSVEFAGTFTWFTLLKSYTCPCTFAGNHLVLLYSTFTAVSSYFLTLRFSYFNCMSKRSYMMIVPWESWNNLKSDHYHFLCLRCQWLHLCFNSW